MPAEHFTLGEFHCRRINERVGPGAGLELLSALPEGILARHAEVMIPDFFDPSARMLILSEHSWVVQVGRFNMLIEACSGNHKTMPKFPRGSHLDTPWLEHLRRAGFAPEDIHYVLCTHLHCDHVGWNTRLLDGRWVPTFPNARYLIARREWDNWNPATRTLPPLDLNENVLEESVLPVIEAGLVDFVDDGYEVEHGITLEPSHGHTLGHISVRARSAGRQALFTGDVIHTPLQIFYPQLNTRACEDPPTAARTRRQTLEECAEHGTLLFPAHFPQPWSVIGITRSGDGFDFHRVEGAAP